MSGRVNRFVMSHGIIRKRTQKGKEIWYGNKLKYKKNFTKPFIYKNPTEKYMQPAYLPIINYCTFCQQW